MRTEVRISKQALIENYKILESLQSGEVWPVIKSNAYGHGAKEVVQCLDHLDFSHWIVQNRHEAEKLFEYTNKQFLMLGAQPLVEYQNLPEQIVPVVSSMNVLEYLIEIKFAGQIHIKINTGMNRQGIEPEEVVIALGIISESEINLVGVMTHFASADEENLDSLQKQESIFREVLEVNPELQSLPYIHTNNSAGIATGSLAESNTHRAGIALYGLSPFSDEKEEFSGLEPVLSFVSYLTQVRTIQPGESVGYGDTFTAEKEMKIGVVPVGYYEGVPRSLSNISEVLVGETPAKILGRVSMNMIIIDLTNTEAQPLDEVIVISPTCGPASAHEHAHRTKTISYEITTNIKAHIPRRVI